MAIYKSSFNKKPEKEVKQKPEKPQKVVEQKPKKKIKINHSVVWLIVFLCLFIACVLPSNFVKNVVLGVVGLSIYPISLVGILFCVLKLSKKQFVAKKRYIAYLVTSVCIVWFIFHLILCSRLDASSYGVFLAATYKAKTTAGGLIFSLISWPITKLLTVVGAYIFSAIALAVFVGLIIDYFNREKEYGAAEKPTKFDFKNIEDFEFDTPEQPAENQEETAKKLAKRRLGLEKGETTIISSSMPNVNISERKPESRPINKREYILTPIEPIIPPENTADDFFNPTPVSHKTPDLSTYDEQHNNTNQQVKNANNFYEDLSQQKQSSNVEEIEPNIMDALMGDDENDHKLTNQSQTTNYGYQQPNQNMTAQNDYSAKSQSETEYQNDDYSAEQEDEYDDLILDEDDNFDASEYAELQAREPSFDQTNSEQNTYGQSSAQTDYQQNGYNASNYNQQNNSSNNVINNYGEDKLSHIEEDYTAEEEYTGETEQFEPTNNQNKPVEEHVDLNKQDYVDEFAYNPHKDNLGSTVETEVVRPSVDISKFHLPNAVKKTLVEEPEQIKIDQIKPKQEIPPYVAPPVELLNYLENTYHISDDELQDNIVRLEQVLEDFKVPAKVNNVQVGPAVTRYELTMPRGISVNKIAQMADDIAMTLASNGSIRVEAPIPGKNSVGIEVPNEQVSAVSLRELIDSEQFRQRANPLSFVLGKDINGDINFCNLDKMPHVLIAGSTGSGKSVCLNTMILSMCYKAGPQDLRLILIDPKTVEFTQYNGLPHLLIPEVITGKEMTINALDWAIKEMERRYALFAKHRVVNIGEYNKLDIVKNKVEEKIPYIVIVVDELADLMLEAKREIEDRIAKLAAKARAAGIHLVLATQRPSVDVITGTVKANLPSRIAFALTNYMDSKTVLDGGGAEKLLGKGDMLFKPLDKPEPKRIQGAFVSNAEISAVVEYIKDHNTPVYDDDTGKTIKNPHQAERSNSADSVNPREMEFDPVLKDALKIFIQNKQASGSMISRRYSVGFNRAGRIMDQMERAGFIGPQEGSKPRQVLITMDEYKAIFGDDEE